MLSDLIIDKTEYTPAVFFSTSSSGMSLNGEARPENANKFFEPIIIWLKQYCELAHNDASFKTNKIIVVNFGLDYFNSSSIKYLYDILKQYEYLKPYVASITINWQYESHDEDMYENGVEFSKIIDIPFTFEKKQHSI
jgi:hypothetical protein